MHIDKRNRCKDSLSCGLGASLKVKYRKFERSLNVLFAFLYVVLHVLSIVFCFTHTCCTCHLLG